MTRTLVRMLALLLGQGPQTDLLLRQVPVRFPVVSGQTPIAFPKPRNECGIEPLGGRGAHARIRTGDLFLTKEALDDHFSIGARLRSNAEAIANNRCLAALPRKSIRQGCNSPKAVG